MENINSYIERHIESKEYKRRLGNATPSFENKLNWIDYLITPDLIYSHRDTFYTKATFIDKFHTHDFCELVVYVAGDVNYLSESRELIPERYDMILSPPGVNHTATLKKDSRYERYVFYFDMKCFGELSRKLGAIFTPGAFRRLDTEGSGTLGGLLGELDSALAENGEVSTVEAYSLVLRIFCLMIKSGGSAVSRPIPAKAAMMRGYIDENLTSQLTISGIAEHFHYSREYLSRFFRQSFNIPVSEYISNQRLELSRRLLREGKSVTEAGLESGFSDVSFYIRRFRQKYGVTPLKYAKEFQEKS